MKKLLYLFLGTLFLLPLAGAADASALELLRPEHLESVINIPSVAPDTMLSDGRCKNDPDGEERCKQDFYLALFTVYFRNYHNLEVSVPMMQPTFLDQNHASLLFDAASEDPITIEITLNYTGDYDAAADEEAKKIASELKSEYTLNGLATLNSIFHSDSTTSAMLEEAAVLYRFGDLKSVTEKYPAYDLTSTLFGVSPKPLFASNDAYLAISKDGFIYDLKKADFNIYNIFYVAEEDSGTIFEKAEKLVSAYFNHELAVEVVATNATTLINEPELDAVVNKHLSQTSGTHTGILTEINFGDQTSPAILVEVPRAFLEDPSVKSIHHSTGVSITTTSHHVPTDTTLGVTDDTDTEYVKAFVMENGVLVEAAFDINLVEVSDGTVITNIPNGVEVYLPTTDKNVGDKITIYHIDPDDATKGETLEGSVVEIDGKLYAKFTTTHFSTYAIGEVIATTNPTPDPTPTTPVVPLAPDTGAPHLENSSLVKLSPLCYNKSIISSANKLSLNLGDKKELCLL